MEGLSLCKTIVSVTNIKGKKFDIFHKRKRLNVFFFPMDSIVDSSAHRSIILTLIARFPFTELVEYLAIKAMETSFVNPICCGQEFVDRN